jgi:hypothetical protein
VGTGVGLGDGTGVGTGVGNGVGKGVGDGVGDGVGKGVGDGVRRRRVRRRRVRRRRVGAGAGPLPSRVASTTESNEDAPSLATWPFASICASTSMDMSARVCINDI